MKRTGKRWIGVGFLMMLPLWCLAQSDTEEQENRKIVKGVTSAFPTTRTLDVSFSSFGKSDYKIGPDGGSREKGTLADYRAVNVASNFKLLQEGKLTLSGNVRYHYLHRSYEDVWAENAPSGLHASNSDFHFWHVGANLMYNTTLMQRHFAISGGLGVDGSEEGAEMLSVNLLANWILSLSQTSYTSVGLYYSSASCGKFWFVPFFSYGRYFPDGWQLDVALPRHVYMRKLFTPESRLSLGVLLDAERHYLYTDGTEYPDELIVSHAMCKAGGMYEHKLGDHFCFTAGAGLSFTMMGRIYDKDHIHHDEVMEFKRNASLYLNVGLSYNLF